MAIRTLCIALSLAWLAPATATEPLSLHEATRRALDRAPLLEARDSALSAAIEEAARAGALPDPMLMVGIENLPVTGDDAFDPAADDMSMKRLGVRQEFPAPAKRAARSLLANSEVDAARIRSESERLAVQRAAAEAWIDAWAARREEAAIRSMRDQAMVAARLAKARAGGGGGTLGDALAAQAAVLEIDIEADAARSKLTAAAAMLARWVSGANADAVAGDPDFATLPVEARRLLQSVDRLAPLRQASAAVETAAAGVALARAEKRSDWSLSAYYGQRSGGRSDMVGVEFGIALPWFAARRQDRGIGAREAEYRAAVSMREDDERQAKAALAADLARWQGLLRQVAMHEEGLLPVARDRSSAALAAYRAGAELQPWLDARRAELELHLAHARHLGELGRAWAALAFLVATEPLP